MKYVIMCGGNYKYVWETPKQLFKVNGEALVDRTIRLLRENGATDIYISATDPRFEGHGVPVLKHENSFEIRGENDFIGYWVDAFYPNFSKDTEVTYLFGDVYFTDNAIRTITQCDISDNVLFGTGIAKNKLHKNWGEPFAYRVTDYEAFMTGVARVKQYQDKGKFDRHPIVWELYRVLNGLELNKHEVLDKNYVVIDDSTMDADSPKKAKGLGT